LIEVHHHQELPSHYDKLCCGRLHLHGYGYILLASEICLVGFGSVTTTHLFTSLKTVCSCFGIIFYPRVYDFSQVYIMTLCWLFYRCWWIQHCWKITVGNTIKRCYTHQLLQRLSTQCVACNQVSLFKLVDMGFIVVQPIEQDIYNYSN
jgi:hypothetical protein